MYKKSLDPKDTICRDLWAYPVIDLTRPRVRTCCKRYGDFITQEQLDELKSDVFLNLPNTIKERRDVMQGHQIEGCKVCWNLENAGNKSFRLGEPDWQYHFNNDEGMPVHHSKFRPFDDLIKDTSDTIVKSTMPNKLDLILGTYCDQKCVYCCADFSTQWELEEIKFGALWNDPRDPKIDHSYIPINKKTLTGWYESFLSWFDTVYEHLERIALLGGEPTFSPFFIPLSEHIIKRLNEKHHPNCSLSIVTNMNWKKNILDQILKIRKELSKEVKLIIEVSMESVEEKAEYIRKGVSWERFISNLETLSKQDNVEIVLVPTINSLCITSFLNYLKKIKELENMYNINYKVIANRVVYPKWLSIDALDSTFRPYVKECIDWLKNNYDVNDYKKKDLIYLLEDIYNILEKTKDVELIGYSIVWLQELDKRRNSDFLKIFPEYKDFVDKHIEYIQPSYDNSHMKKWSY